MLFSMQKKKKSTGISMSRFLSCFDIFPAESGSLDTSKQKYFSHAYSFTQNG